MSEAAVREAIQAAALRTSTGFLKVVGLWTPPATPQQDMFGQVQPPVQSYNLLRQQLSQEYSVRDVDLADGQPPAGIDVLLLVAPQNLTDKQRFAVDQFLMRGGSVVVLAGNYAVTQDPTSGQLALQPLDGHAGRAAAPLRRGRAPDAGAGRSRTSRFRRRSCAMPAASRSRRSRRSTIPSLWMYGRTAWTTQAGITGNLANVALYWTSPVVITGTTCTPDRS